MSGLVKFKKNTKYRFDSFWYNFSWDDYDTLLNGNFSSKAFIFPIVGYLVLINDYVLEKVNFHTITNEIQTTFFLNEDIRLRLIYFGLVFVAVANILYLFKRPYVVKMGTNLREYMDWAMSYWTVSDFSSAHGQIQGSDYGPVSLYGKYYDNDWDAFIEDARWKESGNPVPKMSDKSRTSFSFSAAKKTHEDVLRSILIETYKRESQKRRSTLSICIVIAIFGYTLLAIPSLDLFLRIAQLTIVDLF